MIFDLDMARRFLTLLTGKDDPVVTWMFYPDRKDSSVNTCHVHSTLDYTLDSIRWVQENHGGVSVAVNQFNGEGRKKDDLLKVRACYGDFDKITEAPKIEIDPSICVRTPNGWHYYWLIEDDCSLGSCEDLNKRIAHYHGSDRGAVDCTRVLRCPGFFHCKEEPQRVILEPSSGNKFSLKQLQVLFPPVPIADQVISSIAWDPNSHRSVEGFERYADSALEKEKERVSMSSKGERNDQLNRSSFSLGQLVSAGIIDKKHVYKSLEEACYDNGMIQDDGFRSFENTFMSGIQKGMENPRSLPKQNGIEPEEEGPVLKSEIQKLLLYNQWPDVVKEFKKRSSLNLSPVKTGIGGLDHILGGGIQRGGCTYLMAAPGHGKSSFAYNCMLKYCRETKRPGLFWSIEMPKEDVVARAVTIRHDVSWAQVLIGKNIDETIETRKEYKDSSFYFADYRKCSSIAKFKSIIKSITDIHKEPPFIVVDYMQLISLLGIDKVKEDDQFRAKVTSTSLDLSHIAKEFFLPLLCINSVSRANYSIMYKGKPNIDMALRSGKETGQLEFDAIAVIFMQLIEEDKLFTNHRNGWFSVAKNRIGGGTGSVLFKFDGKHGRFEEALTEKEYLESHPRYKDIINLMAKRFERMSKNEIYKQIGGRRDTVLKLLDRMESMEVIEFVPSLKGFRLKETN